MKSSRNGITVVLIVSSLTLLLVLQAFWLRSSFQDEWQRTHKEASMLFRNTVFDLTDSLLEKSISAIPAGRFPQMKIQVRDSVKIISSPAKLKRSSITIDSSKNVQVFVYGQSDGDTITQFLKPLAERIRGTKGQRAFSIQLNSHPLEKEDIVRKYRSALRQADLPLLFEVECSPHTFDLTARPLRPEDEQSVITPAGLYRVSLSNLNNFAWKRITPQIVFSVFLTALTSISFFMLFRNIRTQQRLAELKNDFISNMTHELKTPVTTVGVALEALKNFNGLENPKLTQEYLAIAQNELSRLSLLTDKILKTSVFENNGIDVGQEAIDLEKVVEQTVQSLKLVFEKANAQVTIEKEGNDFTLKGGLVHVTNVVYNLLDNALKYSPDHPRINFRLKSQPEHVVMIVQDEGVGIPSEFKKKIFEKFFRVPTGDVHTVKGYGLGLSYVDAVVKAHGGTIEVDSLPGKGSSFTITWPRQRV